MCACATNIRPELCDHSWQRLSLCTQTFTKAAFLFFFSIFDIIHAHFLFSHCCFFPITANLFYKFTRKHKLEFLVLFFCHVYKRMIFNQVPWNHLDAHHFTKFYLTLFRHIHRKKDRSVASSFKKLLGKKSHRFGNTKMARDFPLNILFLDQQGM